MKFDTQGFEFITQGDWKIVTHRKKNKAADAFRPYISIESGGRRICSISVATPYKVSAGDFLESNANALLISRAPRLLHDCYIAAETLRDVLSGAVCKPHIEQVIAALDRDYRAAIGDDYNSEEGKQEEDDK